VSNPPAARAVSAWHLSTCVRKVCGRTDLCLLQTQQHGGSMQSAQVPLLIGHDTLQQGAYMRCPSMLAVACRVSAMCRSSPLQLRPLHEDPAQTNGRPRHSVTRTCNAAAHRGLYIAAAAAKTHCCQQCCCCRFCCCWGPECMQKASWCPCVSPEQQLPVSSILNCSGSRPPTAALQAKKATAA
jgi:hypothetical protein